MIRYDWSLEEVRELFHTPLLTLLSKAHLVHLEFHPPEEIQVCALISIKTGGCPEDCKYCAQSSRYQTSISAQPMMKKEEVIRAAKKAVSEGASRICLGAAQREVKEGKQFDLMLEMVKEIAEMGVEVCCTLGMLNEEQAKRLMEAGLYAYNHNLDTSEEHYKSIITTRTYQERLETLDVVDKAGLSLCCGGILGLGEKEEDRVQLLHTLCTRDPHPDSVPINRLTPIAGTPLAEAPPLSFWEMLRVIATARIVMPKAMLRLSAGRKEMSCEEQALAFLAGANSIFGGEKLLTVPNSSRSTDDFMFEILGLKKRVPSHAACC